jgi:sugar phosphate isomerase/epimerase
MSATRLRHPDGTTVHLSYGTNVHPAESLDGVLAQLDRFAEPVRLRLGWDRLGLGLWLAAGVAAVLAEDAAALRRLRAELDARGLEVVTLNAFPYRGFHDTVVKHAVYDPSWTDPRRARYTLDCAAVLCGLLPDDVEGGSISTLPLGWRSPWTPRDDAAALAALRHVTGGLRQLPRPIRLAVEPEPGCVLDTVADAVRWLANTVDPDVVGVCLDTCHLAVSFADPAAAVHAILASGLPIAKVQASAALQALEPSAARGTLASFVEPRYLHQVRAGPGHTAGIPVAADDLPEAFDTLPEHLPWRVHFHVPLHATPEPPLTATTDVLETALRALYRGATAGSPHVEVETYTWGVLPEQARPADDTGLVAGIAAELRYASDQLVRSGLSRDPSPGSPPEQARQARDGVTIGGTSSGTTSRTTGVTTGGTSSGTTGVTIGGTADAAGAGR